MLCTSVRTPPLSCEPRQHLLHRFARYFSVCGIGGAAFGSGGNSVQMYVACEFLQFLHFLHRGFVSRRPSRAAAARRNISGRAELIPVFWPGGHNIWCAWASPAGGSRHRLRRGVVSPARRRVHGAESLYLEQGRIDSRFLRREAPTSGREARGSPWRFLDSASHSPVSYTHLTLPTKA